MSGTVLADPERILELSRHVDAVARKKIQEINVITRETRTLALNAKIEPPEQAMPAKVSVSSPKRSS